MNDHIFNQLCETYGMAPTKPLRDLVEAVWKKAREPVFSVGEDTWGENSGLFHQAGLHRVAFKPLFECGKELEVLVKLVKGAKNDPQTTR